jgi:hypothetical protein
MRNFFDVDVDVEVCVDAQTGLTSTPKPWVWDRVETQVGTLDPEFGGDFPATSKTRKRALFCRSVFDHESGHVFRLFPKPGKSHFSDPLGPPPRGGGLG